MIDTFSTQEASRLQRLEQTMAQLQAQVHSLEVNYQNLKSEIGILQVEKLSRADDDFQRILEEADSAAEMLYRLQAALR